MEVLVGNSAHADYGCGHDAVSQNGRRGEPDSDFDSSVAGGGSRETLRWRNLAGGVGEWKL